MKSILERQLEKKTYQLKNVIIGLDDFDFENMVNEEEILMEEKFKLYKHFKEVYGYFQERYEMTYEDYLIMRNKYFILLDKNICNCKKGFNFYKDMCEECYKLNYKYLCEECNGEKIDNNRTLCDKCFIIIQNTEW